ncbi:MAG: hypothetical protein J3K34DRAFT_162153 [Monoraphidium minutum]|nr:MAG: hypothetical protein J3K34DRAFT_162153 [Monoraphidium minutum]
MHSIGAQRTAVPGAITFACHAGGTAAVRVARSGQHVAQQLHRCHTLSSAAAALPAFAEGLLPSDPVVRAALKEPVAFFGGVFAGALGLSERDEPLRGWVERTAAQAGVPPPSSLSRTANGGGGGGGVSSKPSGGDGASRSSSESDGI